MIETFGKSSFKWVTNTSNVFCVYFRELAIGGDLYDVQSVPPALNWLQ